MRLALIASFVAAAVFAAPAAALVGSLQKAANALRQSPVYVDPNAALTLPPAQVAKLRNAIANAGEPIYIAVLPQSAADRAGGDPNEVLRLLRDDLGRRGTYAVVVGKHFRAGSTDLPRGTAGRLATDAFNAHRGEGLAAVLLDFVHRVQDERSGGGGRHGFSGGALIAILAAGAAVLFGARALRRRRATQIRLEDVRSAAKDELVALAEDVQRLEQPTSFPGADPRAAEAYRRALGAYDTASHAFDRARRPEDLEHVSSAIEEGRYEMASAEALLAGREPPERRAPCFFDPRHGPSSRDVEWAPPGGTPRPVPACEADAQRVERGEDPASREVLVGGVRTPYWAAPGYMPFYGGFFPGLFLGELLGGGFYGGYGDQPGSGLGDFGGGGGGFGGGDFGGGDGGGGDF
ncbi:MAG: hypothetical protein E6G08_13400 [Actinobacteria bacterium]|nr:MAG: hypothetical protein E6G08_13400 [Actinomycetota bacterium]